MLPNRDILFVSITFSSFDWISRDRLEISSRNTVPPSACWNFPWMKLSFSISPKSSLSILSSDKFALLISMNGFPDLVDSRWICLAMSSFPVPLSPVIKTLEFNFENFLIRSKTLFIFLLLPIILVESINLLLILWSSSRDFLY